MIPNATPSPTLYDELEGRGVTGTMGFAFDVTDPALAEIEAKRDAIEGFAETFIRR